MFAPNCLRGSLVKRSSTSRHPRAKGFARPPLLPRHPCAPKTFARNDHLKTVSLYSPTGKVTGQYQTQQFMLETSALMTYDADDRLLSQTNGAGDIVTYTYDGVGNVIGVTDGNGNTTSYAYDSMDQLTTVTDALGHSTVIGYDGSGNEQTVTDALGHTTTTLYDAIDRATTIISALGGTTTMTYDAAGRETF